LLRNVLQRKPAYLCLLFLRFGSGSRRVGSAAVWRSPEYIIPVIGSRNTRIIPIAIGTTEKQAAYNLHYVNIALGIYFWRVFLYPVAVAQLLPVLFLPLKINPHKTKAGIPPKRDKSCCSRVAAKSMTGKRAGRDGRGEG